MDYDADGDRDILSGSYTGEIYLFEGDAQGRFAQGRFLLDSTGAALRTGTSVTPEAVDMDGDGDLDLVIGTRTDGVFVVDNLGTRSIPEWSPTPRPLLTVEGEPLKGSNAHQADWDGDGIADMIVGSEWGGASWYRNVGTALVPKYGPVASLVEPERFAERSEEQGPAGPGLRTKVHVTDWNGDGRADLLIGDVQWLYETLPPLTAQQQAEKDALLPALEAAQARFDAVIEERNAHVRTGEKTPVEVLLRLEQARVVLSPLRAKWSVFDRRATRTHGWVWLYLRDGPTADPGAARPAALKSASFGPVTLDVELQASPEKGAVGLVKATLSLESGWHVYARTPAGSPYPATRPSLVGKHGEEIGVDWNCATPTHRDPKDPGFSWYTSEVTFSGQFVLPEDEDAELRVRVHFQVCDDQMCLPPKTLGVEFRVPENR